MDYGVLYEWLREDPDVSDRIATLMDAIVDRHPYQHDEAATMAAFEGPRAAAVHATILRELAGIAEQRHAGLGAAG